MSLLEALERWNVGMMARWHVASHGTFARKKIWRVGTVARSKPWHVAGLGRSAHKKIWHVGTLAHLAFMASNLADSKYTHTGFLFLDIGWTSKHFDLSDLRVS